MYEDRIQKAVDLFKKGYNCSQAVVAAYADLYGYSEEQALRMAASFGGGIGRMRQTCGAACGMFLLLGLDCGEIDAENREGKAHNYAMVQNLANKFKEENGSLFCAELLGVQNSASTSFQPEARTEAYYKKRPCAMMVETAARIFAKYLENKTI